MATLGKQRDIRMTEGSIVQQLLLFSLPLLAGNFFQQCYNTVDSIVVGNFVGKAALAAVGSVNNIINTLIGLFLGLSAGIGVVISQLYGAREEERVGKAVQTSLLLVLAMCVLFTAAGIAMVPFMLDLMATPADVYQEAAAYLRIYFAGVSGLMLYNLGSGILRAVGDSRRPLYFLIFSACLNTVLDLLFVAGFRWGIAGAAIATVASQGVSALLVLAVLTRTDGCYRIVWRGMGLDKRILRNIFIVGVPSALQLAVTSFSNVFVQSYVNRFDSSCMAGWAAYNKIDAFALLPMLTLSVAATTFVGQNVGAGNWERARAGGRWAMIMATVSTLVILIPLMLFARSLCGLFNQDEAMLAYGTYFIRVISPFYLIGNFNQIYAGVLRGAGDATRPTLIMLVSFVAFRQIYLFVTYRVFGTLLPVALGYPVGWVLCSILLFLYYRSGRWMKHSFLTEPSATA
ncbi:MAG: MATE family efflux transporter [Bacillota bacterium]|nr:MATE family efflux transporter [Bacillota bacterium]